DGPRQLRFEGYSTDQDGLPTYRYRLNAADPQSVLVNERPEPLHSTVAAGVTRKFTLEVPAEQTAWLFAGEAHGEPRLLDGKGTPVPLDLQAGKAEVPATDRLLVLPDGEHVTVLSLAAGPEGCSWRLYKVGDRWQALLRVPPAKGAATFEVSLKVWAPYRDEPG